jgi:hypothetical protein
MYREGEQSAEDVERILQPSVSMFPEVWQRLQRPFSTGLAFNVVGAVEATSSHKATCLWDLNGVRLSQVSIAFAATWGVLPAGRLPALL